ncbi:unnamed protein product [Hermetia illucens]|uniref:Uncharacterized protein n=1 Tax=Hermetia illucens TaxID=343691 RepID=A0A7R8Z069_HERIL|nr:acetylcholine receptor subunit alpha-like [Hermetia illucens]CAD7088441.1 unnamed protein product [Hermetia illucens]
MEITWVLILNFFLVLCLERTFGSRYNVSLSDLVKCKEYRIESGYVYRNFFLLDEFRNNRTENERFRFKFYVMAASNAHILLSPMDKAKKGDSVYEIVIGAGGNTFSTIRPQIGGRQLIVKKQNGLLNGIDPTPIIVVQKTDGTLEVTIPTFVGALLSYKDPKPLNIKYVSFSSYGSTSARWFYDCGGDEETHMEMKKENLTSLERLQVDLFANYSIFTIPDELSKIYMGATIKGVSYNERKSIFQVRLEVKLKWTDPKLKWKPSEYSNITALRSFEVNFWTPSLLITNGAGSTFTHFDPEYFGIIYSNGSIEADTKQQVIETWCRESQDGNWPWDELRCPVDFAVDGNHLSIDFDLAHSVRAPKISELSKWRFSGRHLVTKTIKPFADMGNDLNSTVSVASLVIHMRRNAFYYRKVFFVPLIAATILILLSFIMRRLLRGILNLIALALLLGSFLALTNSTPVTYVPKITHSYEMVIGIACFSYFMSILIRWFSDCSPEQPPSNCILAVINNSVLRAVLGIQFANSEEYLKIQYEPWKQVGIILDRIIFFILLLVLVIILSSGF